MMEQSTIDTAIQAWSLPGDLTCRPVEGKDNILRLLADGEMYYLKRRPVRYSAERECALLSWLLTEGLPVAPPLQTTQGQPAITLGDDLLVLYRALPGEITTDHYGQGAVERAFGFGAGIARLHEAFARYPQATDYQRSDLLGENTGWISREIEQHAGDLHGVLSAVGEFLRDLQAQVPAQLIHRDAHPSNMLMADTRVTGYVDFDLSCVGLRLFDPCYTLTGMLAGDFAHEEHRRQWLSLVPALFSGYQSVQPLLEVERKGIVDMMLAIELLFVAFGYRIDNPVMAKTNTDIFEWLLENRQRIEDAINEI